MSRAKRESTKLLEELDWLIETGELNELRAKIIENPDLLHIVGQYQDTLLSRAVDRNDIVAVTLLLDLGAPIDRPKCFHTCLQSALHPDNPTDLEVFQLLVDHGADLEARGVETWTALHAAAAWGVEPAIHVLIQRGANIEAREVIDNEWTPLMCASFNNQIKAIQSLLEHGANKAARDLSGRTAADLAKQQGYDDAIRVFD